MGVSKSSTRKRAGAVAVRSTKKKKTRKSGGPTSVVEAALLQLVHEGTSDAARVSAAKALMDLVKYMNGENDRAAQSDDRQRMEAIREARRLLAEFAALKFGGTASAGAVGLEQADEVAHDGASGTDHAAG